MQTVSEFDVSLINVEIIWSVIRTVQGNGNYFLIMSSIYSNVQSGVHK